MMNDFKEEPEELRKKKISSAISEQVALIGSRSLYERIDKNFKELKFEAFLAKVKLIICYRMMFLSWSGAF